VAYKPETRQKVRSDFVKGLSLKAAAAEHDIPYQTARGWKRKAATDGDDWDNARAALRISSGGVKALTAAVIEDFVHLFQATLEALKNDKNTPALQKADAIAKLSDAYQKTVKAAGNSDPALSRLSIVLDVLQKQMLFIREHFPQYVEIFMEILEPLGEALSREIST
jgi:hypothetical protein